MNLDDLLNKLLDHHLERRLEELLTRRVEELLAPKTGAAPANDRSLATREAPGIDEDPPLGLMQAGDLSSDDAPRQEDEIVNGRLLLKRFRRSTRHPNKRVKIRCLSCLRESIVGEETYRKRGCKCRCNDKVDPQLRANRLDQAVETIATRVRSKLVGTMKLGEEQRFNSTEWGRFFDLDPRVVGRALARLSKGDPELIVYYDDKNAVWVVERKAV